MKKQLKHEKKPKVVIVALYEVYPPSFGAAVVTYNIFKYLRGKTYLVQIGARKKRL